MCCNETAAGVQCEVAGGESAIPPLRTAAARHVMRAVAALLHLKKEEEEETHCFLPICFSICYLHHVLDSTVLRSKER